MNQQVNNLIMNGDENMGQVERSPVDEQLFRKQRLAAALRIFGRFGFDEGVAGHITVRDPLDPETFWVNPMGRSFKMMRGLTGVADRDLDTLQRIVDERMVPAEDTLTLQAMGVVFGDLLGERLDMDWVVYRDNKGRSRALRYRQMDVYLFPVTMISRRQEGGSGRPLQPLFDNTVRDTRLLLPGGKWFQ